MILEVMVKIFHKDMVLLEQFIQVIMDGKCVKN